MDSLAAAEVAAPSAAAAARPERAVTVAASQAAEAVRLARAAVAEVTATAVAVMEAPSGLESDWEPPRPVAPR